MPVKAYSLLKCKPLQYGIGSGHPPGGKPKQGGHPHFQILAEGKKGQLHRIAVNIISGEAKPGKGESLIRMNYDSNFKLDSLTQKLKKTNLGFQPLPSKPDGLALDFVRLQGLVDTSSMKKMPFLALGPKNDLQDILTDLLDEAIAGAYQLFAFGAAWTDTKTVFFANENGGIHDIHCNQGNPKAGGHSGDNGIWQDGALLFYNEKKNSWKAVFMAFESQFTGATIATNEKGGLLNEKQAPPKKAPAKKKAVKKAPVKKAPKKKAGKKKNK